MSGVSFRQFSPESQVGNKFTALIEGCVPEKKVERERGQLVIGRYSIQCCNLSSPFSNCSLNLQHRLNEPVSRQLIEPMRVV